MDLGRPQFIEGTFDQFWVLCYWRWKKFVCTGDCLP